jgi:hypothetical protein
MQPENRAATTRPKTRRPVGFWTMIVLFSLAAIVFQIGAHIVNFQDYVGPDPDDSMRLVEVRDFLAGQSWFDLTQYRLGLDGGTLMHWSRVIDLPIAALITFFSLFLSRETAEAAALIVWPSLLVFPLMVSAALAAQRTGGDKAVPIALGLTVLFLAAIIRFRPGNIDHHNVQLVLTGLIAAMLLDPQRRASNFAIAGIASAFALAIGVETTPYIAVAAVVVAGLWAYGGEIYRRAAIGFGLTFAGSTGALFIATTPAHLLTAVTCDSLSFGFFALTAVGGSLFAVIALVASGFGRELRFASLAVAGAAMAGLAVLIMPECLRSPYAILDPLLITMWLGNVTEAQSILSELATSPETVGGFYAVGIIALAVSAFRIVRREKLVTYSVLFVLIGTCWAVSAFQVRGMIFANFLAFIPLSALIADLRALYLTRQKDSRAALAFITTALASLPSVWMIAGVTALDAGQAVAGIHKPVDNSATEKACITADSVRPLNKFARGRILSTANPGSLLLRFTPHSVLTANYHRNQRGMLEALHISMATPDAAKSMLKADGITLVVFCKDDPQIGLIEARSADGFFAELNAGKVPDYLEPVKSSDPGRLKIFRVLE